MFAILVYVNNKQGETNMNRVKLAHFIYKTFGEINIKLRATRHYEYDGDHSWFEDVKLVVSMYYPEEWMQRVLNKKPTLQMYVSGYYLSNGFGSAFEDEVMNIFKSKTGKIYEDNKEFFEKVGSFIAEENAHEQRKKETEKHNSEVENNIKSLEHTMITKKEASELIKEKGCAIFKKSFIKVQEWANNEKTSYFVKSSHTIAKIKPLTVNGLYSKEDILKAIA